jgi:hypothetical protein
MFEAGPVNNGGMGQSPLSWTDIKTWSDMTGVEVSGWEGATIRRLSSSYLSEYQQAKDPSRPAPYSPNITEHGREQVSNKIGSIFGAMIKQQKGK